MFVKRTQGAEDAFQGYAEYVAAELKRKTFPIIIIHLFSTAVSDLSHLENELIVGRHNLSLKTQC